jgi:2',3'-cyclic-nucleotide 2'-phosphodiesterase (5'-nucleotidase family)
MRGRAESCGCGGGPRGGLMRRAALYSQLFKNDTPLSIDCGGILDLDPNGGLSQSRCTIHGLGRLGLKAMGVTPRDLFYGIDFLRLTADTAQIALISANIVDSNSRKPLFATWKKITAGGKTLAITSLAEYIPQRRLSIAGNWEVISPDSVLPMLFETAPDSVDLVVLLTDMSEPNIRRIMLTCTLFDLAFTSTVHIFSATPFTTNRTIVANPEQDGRTIDGIMLGFNGKNIYGTRWFSIPIGPNVSIDKNTAEWLGSCLGRPVDRK